MWLLSNVPIEGGGQSRKWVNWRDLYYPGGFIKCTSHNLSLLLSPPSYIQSGLSRTKACFLRWPTMYV